MQMQMQRNSLRTACQARYLPCQITTIPRNVALAYVMREACDGIWRLDMSLNSRARWKMSQTRLHIPQDQDHSLFPYVHPRLKCITIKIPSGNTKLSSFQISEKRVHGDAQPNHAASLSTIPESRLCHNRTSIYPTTPTTRSHPFDEQPDDRPRHQTALRIHVPRNHDL